jgi:hypothetical protein
LFEDMCDSTVGHKNLAVCFLSYETLIKNIKIVKVIYCWEEMDRIKKVCCNIAALITAFMSLKKTQTSKDRGQLPPNLYLLMHRASRI